MRLVLVSNRLPVTGSLQNGEIVFSNSAGGLATGLSSYLFSQERTQVEEYLWIGWPGLTVDDTDQNRVTFDLKHKYNCVPVFYSEKSYNGFYVDFCNSTLWPLFHSFHNLVIFNEVSWSHYKKINELYLQAIIETVQDGDIIWIHDFHLLLLPQLIRNKFPNARIGFFLHIPFPSFDIFRILTQSWKQEILNGMLGADLVGFHVHDYAQDFSKCVDRILNLENKVGKIFKDNRVIKVDSYPMGINYDAFRSAAQSEDILNKRREIRDRCVGSKLILSIDRLDYTKGIVNRLLAFESLLTKRPSLRQKISLILIVVPSRIDVNSYQMMKDQIDNLVGKINGAFSTENWLPVSYQYKSKTFDELVLLYSSVDVALITPLRDGMNLIAKEFAASRSEQTGVLILSEMAGASFELLDAKLINPNQISEIEIAIEESLNMSAVEQKERMTSMQTRIKEYDIVRWSEDFITDINNTRDEVSDLKSKSFNKKCESEFLKSYAAAKKRLLLIDYDGTLVEFAKFPELACPSANLIETLSKITEDPNTFLFILSGRDRFTLEKWFGSISTGFVAENGSWVKINKNWTMVDRTDDEWKKVILPILKKHIARLPGSFAEEKEFSIVWHFRNSENSLSVTRMKELQDELSQKLGVYDLEVSSEIKSIEIRKKGTSKAKAVKKILETMSHDFVACWGDDTSDERVFDILPHNAVTFKVGIEKTAAKFNLLNSTDVKLSIEKIIEHQLQEAMSATNDYFSN